MTVSTDIQPPAARARPSAARVVNAMVIRDLRVIGRTSSQFLLNVVLQPLFFAFCFAYVIPEVGAGFAPASGPGDGPPYSTVLVPGLVAASMTFAGMMGVTLPLIAELGIFREIEDRALAPIPVWLLGAQKILSGSMHALLAAAVTFPVVLLVHAGGEAPSADVSNWPLFMGVLTLAALLIAAFGLLLGTVTEPSKAHLLFTAVLTPAIFLGCIYYPWASLDTLPWLKWAVLVNPIVYISEGLRAALTPEIGHMPIWAVLTALVGGLAVVGGLALRAFTRRVVV